MKNDLAEKIKKLKSEGKKPSETFGPSTLTKDRKFMNDFKNDLENILKAVVRARELISPARRMPDESELQNAEDKLLSATVALRKILKGIER